MCLFAPCVLVAEETSFSRDVMTVLSKAGCNAGACYGNQNGKGGFKLSLWGGIRGRISRHCNPAGE